MSGFGNGVRCFCSILVTLSGLASACGGSDAPASNGSGGAMTMSPPMLDSSEDIAALSDADKGALCDWISAEYGGYGAVTECKGGMGSVINYTDRAECVTSLHYNCVVAVAQLETCVMARAPTLGCD